jgi:hypothetical protein
MIIGLVGCSQSSTPTPAANVHTPAYEPQLAAELLKLTIPPLWLRRRLFAIFRLICDRCSVF